MAAATADIPAPDGKPRTSTTNNFSTISSSFSYFLDLIIIQVLLLLFLTLFIPHVYAIRLNFQLIIGQLRHSRLLFSERLEFYRNQFVLNQTRL
jgi:hypothetical protein